jgi:hypothetical protein
MTIPCEECLIIPICRNKTFRTLLRQCSIIKDFTCIASGICNPSYKHEIFRAIKPRLWRVTQSGTIYFTYEFINRFNSHEIKTHLMRSRRDALEEK